MSEALAGMGGNDLVRQMAGCLQTVQDADDAAQREGALNTLEEMCEDIDLARGAFDLQCSICSVRAAVFDLQFSICSFRFAQRPMV